MTQTGTSGPEPGKSIAKRYTLGAELARGGMGSVWSARDELEERDVAIKFQASSLLDSTSHRRFGREADALCRLSSPHIVRFLSAGSEANLSYIVMELLIGQTLRDQLRARGALGIPEVTRIVAQAALGLSVAHEADIVHRDVKPSNLFMALVAGSPQLKVIDFGIAKPTGLGASGDGTASGIVGSPAYMSPEQARGEILDHRTDVWALAVVAFTLLSGREPFTEADVPATLQRICRGDARLINSLSPQLPPALNAFFKRAFAVDRRARFQSVSELSASFQRACSDEEALQILGRCDDTKSLTLTAPVPIRGRLRSRVLFGGAVLATTVVTLAATSRSFVELEARSPPGDANHPAVSRKDDLPVLGAPAPAASGLEFAASSPPRPLAPRIELPATASAQPVSGRPSRRGPALSTRDRKLSVTAAVPASAGPPSAAVPPTESSLELRALPRSPSTPADSDELDRRF
jgi:hypothetical protein